MTRVESLTSSAIYGVFTPNRYSTDRWVRYTWRSRFCHTINALTTTRLWRLERHLTWTGLNVVAHLHRGLMAVRLLLNTLMMD